MLKLVTQTQLLWCKFPWTSRNTPIFFLYVGKYLSRVHIYYTGHIAKFWSRWILFYTSFLNICKCHAQAGSTARFRPSSSRERAPASFRLLPSADDPDDRKNYDDRMVSFFLNYFICLNDATTIHSRLLAIIIAFVFLTEAVWANPNLDLAIPKNPPSKNW